MKMSLHPATSADTNLGTRKTTKLSMLFDRITNAITRAAGRPGTSLASIALVLIWAASGPLFDFSEKWQLLINTSTTIITFLMVFVIQTSANKDTIAVQLKLNELIAANKLASNRLIDIEDLTADELEVLKKYYVKLSDLAEREKDIFGTHSIDEANRVHKHKTRSTGKVRSGA